MVGFWALGPTSIRHISGDNQRFSRQEPLIQRIAQCIMCPHFQAYGIMGVPVLIIVHGICTFGMMIIHDYTIMITLLYLSNIATIILYSHIVHDVFLLLVGFCFGSSDHRIHRQPPPGRWRNERCSSGTTTTSSVWSPPVARRAIKRAGGLLESAGYIYIDR